MKRIQAIFPCLVYCFLVTLLACSKFPDENTTSGGSNQQEYFTTSASIFVNQPYEYDLSRISADGTAVITSQAQHFSVSTVYRSGNKLLYRYVPAVNYIGSDQATIQVRTGAAGNNLQITNLTISIDIFR